MIQCEAMEDRMPDVAHGRAVWSPVERAHLADCAECSASWRLIQLAPRIGQAAADGLDVPRLTSELHQRLRLSPAGRSRWKRAGWLTGLAAAAVLSVMVWRGQQEPPAGTGTVVTAAAGGFMVPLAELEGLDGDQLEAVLEALDAPLGTTGGGPAPSFDDLDDSQLERILRSLEG